MDRAALWAHGISGDLPIVLVCIDKADDVDIVRQLLRAHEYWRMRQLSTDVIILNEKASSYEQGSARLAGRACARQSVCASARISAGREAISIFCGLTCSPHKIGCCCSRLLGSSCLSRRGTLAEQVTRLQRRSQYCRR